MSTATSVLPFPTTELRFHPLSGIFPLLEGTAYAALVTDIRDNGLLEPIVLFDGMVLDGRNRYRACRDAGVKLRTETFSGNDALKFVVSVNLHRRHLNESQREMSAAKIADMPQGARTDLPPNGERLSQAAAAELLNVSVRSVQRAVTVRKKAQPEVIAAVESGVMAVSTAAHIASKPREQQLGRLARDERKADGTHRQADDFYRTPPESTRALLAVEKFPAKIWEPACGDGAISRVLQDAGHDVISTDLVDRGFGKVADFLAERKRRADCLITNPPFKIDDEFAMHAIELGVPRFALLARLTWLEGTERYERLWSRQMLARVWVFSTRQTLWRGDDAAAETDGGMTAYAWFVFEQKHRGRAQVDWLTAGGSSP